VLKMELIPFIAMQNYMEMLEDFCLSADGIKRNWTRYLPWGYF